MLEQFLGLANDVVPQTLPHQVQQEGVSQSAVSQVASQSLYSGMQELLQHGGPGALKNLFQGAAQGDTGNPQMQHMTNHFSGNLTNQLGISSGMAKTIAMAVIPMLISRFFNRTKDPNDNSFDITNILGSLLGGGVAGGFGGMLGGNSGGGGLGSVLGGMLGGGAPASRPQQSGLGGMLDRDGDGDTDMADLMAMFR